MENKDKITAGIIGLVALLVGFGGSQMLTEEQIDKAYVCELTEELAIFDRVSDSQKTGYYTENGSEEAERCNEGYNYGKWIPLREYAEMNNITVDEFLNEENKENKTNPSEYSSSKYKCNSQGCSPIE